MYKYSLFFGISPLFIGVLIYFGWLFSRFGWLQVAGTLNIVFGLVAFCIGIICLAIYAYKSSKQNKYHWGRKAILSLAILLSNFPVAAAIIYHVTYIQSTYYVVINNNSAYEITDIVVTAKNQHMLNNITPMSVSRYALHFDHEGAVNYSMIFNHVKHTGVLFGYVTWDHGHTAVMEVTHSGSIKIKEQF